MHEDRFRDSCLQEPLHPFLPIGATFSVIISKKYFINLTKVCARKALLKLIKYQSENLQVLILDCQLNRQLVVCLALPLPLICILCILLIHNMIFLIILWWPKNCQWNQFIFVFRSSEEELHDFCLVIVYGK